MSCDAHPGNFLRREWPFKLAAFLLVYKPKCGVICMWNAMPACYHGWLVRLNGWIGSLREEQGECKALWMNRIVRCFSKGGRLASQIYNISISFPY